MRRPCTVVDQKDLVFLNEFAGVFYGAGHIKAVIQCFVDDLAAMDAAFLIERIKVKIGALTILQRLRAQRA